MSDLQRALDEIRNTEAYRTEAAVLDETEPLWRRIRELEDALKKIAHEPNFRRSAQRCRALAIHVLEGSQQTSGKIDFQPGKSQLWDAVIDFFSSERPMKLIGGQVAGLESYRLEYTGRKKAELLELIEAAVKRDEEEYHRSIERDLQS